MCRTVIVVQLAEHLPGVQANPGSNIVIEQDFGQFLKWPNFL